MSDQADGDETPTTREAPTASAPSPTAPSDQEQQAAERMCAITISRLYGSGGGEIAARLAQRLGWRLIDHEVVVRVAHSLGITEEEAEARDEHTADLISRILSSFSLVYPSPEPLSPPTPADGEHIYQQTLREVIEQFTTEGHVIIVGRGSHLLLADRRDVLRVAIAAPLRQRIAYVIRREGLDEARATERIRRKDADRRRYVETHYHQRPFQPEDYDLSVNTAILSLDQTLDLICLALTQKAQRLDTPAAELGPVAGLPRYPDHPEDVPLPEDA
ncbi:MAG: cytidylate kinase-like family protein [Ktedonobacterales bacterium]